MINISAYAGQAIFILTTILIMVAISSVLIYFVWNKKYNIFCRIRYETNTYDKVKDVKAKYDKTKDKLIIRESLFKYFSMPTPSSEVISLNVNGKDMVEIIITPDGSKKYVKVTRTETEQIHETLNSPDKVFYFNELEKRNERKKKSIGELLLFLAPYFILVIILGMLLGFWGTVMEPFNERMERAESFELKMMAHLEKTQEGLNEILAKEQIIRDYERQNSTIPD